MTNEIELQILRINKELHKRLKAYCKKNHLQIIHFVEGSLETALSLDIDYKDIIRKEQMKKLEGKNE